MAPLKSLRGNSPLATLALSLAACLAVVSVVSYPKQAFEASLHGLTVWWNIVFPGLLPFLILTELLIGLGMMHFLGVLLEPAMRAGFRLPGASGWAVAAGAAAGHAAAAQATARLRERDLIGRADGERLLAMSYACPPVVIVGVVASGFFGQPKLGWALLGVHFAAWLAVGLLLRAVADSAAPPAPADAPFARAVGSALRRALGAMREARAEDGRSFGRLLGDAVLQAVAALMMIGGYMLLFSVLFEMARVSGLYPALLRLAASAAEHPAAAGDASGALLAGLMELHLGTYAASRTPLPVALQAAFASAVLAWGGLAAHAQVKSLVGDTDLSLRWFVAARLLHGLFAFVLALALWKPVWSRFVSDGTDAVLGMPEAAAPGGGTSPAEAGWLAPAAAEFPEAVPGLWQLWPGSLLLVLAALLALALLSAWARRRTG